MVFTEATCLECGIEFRYPVAYGKVAFCSAVCRVARTPPKEPWEFKGCSPRKYYSKRRRRHIEAGDKIDALVVYLAFDWTCMICRGKIDPALQMPDPMSASIDHIVPLSLGGTHTWDNVMPSHLGCNNSKDINDITEGSDRERLPVPFSR